MGQMVHLFQDREELVREAEKHIIKEQPDTFQPFSGTGSSLSDTQPNHRPTNSLTDSTRHIYVDEQKPKTKIRIRLHNGENRQIGMFYTCTEQRCSNGMRASFRYAFFRTNFK